MNPNKVGYPRIVRSDGLPVKEYKGILFNGDCAVYKKAVIKLLKKEGVDPKIIKEVKKLHYDLEISTVLINNHLMDDLLTVYSMPDAVAAFEDYIENVYMSIENKISEFPLRDAVEGYLGGKKKLSKHEIDDLFQKIDSEIIDVANDAISELHDFHNGREQELREEFRQAQLKRKKAIDEEIIELSAEIARLESLLSE